MTVFKTFLKILNKNKFIVIMYTIILLVFGGFNMQNSESSINFVPTKPDVMIINNDSDNIITNNFISYLEKNSNIKEKYDSEEKINDALFYREINYIIYIPSNYGSDFLNKKNPKLEIKSTGDYMASLTEMMVNRYVKVANIYNESINDTNKLINVINNTLDKEMDVEITSKLDSSSLEKAAFYYNFEAYSLLACLIYVICLILSTFNKDVIHKRIVISSIDYKKYNRQLLLSNCLYSLLLWFLYLVMSFILIGNIMFTVHGLLFMINSLVFTICATTIAFLLGSLVTKKEAINGIMNVVALGFSFLCGVFVPQSWLPNSVITISHLLPAYYYVRTNDLIKELEVFDFNSLCPLLINMIIVLGFSCLFIIITNYISNKKRKIG